MPYHRKNPYKKQEVIVFTSGQCQLIDTVRIDWRQSTVTHYPAAGGAKS